MSNRWKALLIISMVFNAAVVVALVYGLTHMPRIGERPQRGPHTRETMNRRCRSLAEDIGLSRAKAVRFEGIMAGSEGRADSVRTLLHRSREELFELIWAEAPERDAIMEKVDEVAALQGELERLLVANLLEARAILDPDEEERFFEHMKDRMGPSRRHKRRPPADQCGNGGLR